MSEVGYKGIKVGDKVRLVGDYWPLWDDHGLESHKEHTIKTWDEGEYGIEFTFEEFDRPNGETFGILNDDEISSPLEDAWGFYKVGSKGE